MLDQTRKAALSLVQSIIIPRVSGRLLLEINGAGKSEYRLLGKIVGEHERAIESSFSKVASIEELESLQRKYGEEELENSIRSKFVMERVKRLAPLVEKVTSQLSFMENELACTSWTDATQGIQSDVISDTLKRFGVEDESRCRTFQSQSQEGL